MYRRQRVSIKYNERMILLELRTSQARIISSDLLLILKKWLVDLTSE